MFQPKVDVKIVRIGERDHFVRVIPPVAPRPDERTHYSSYATQPMTDECSGIMEYALTKEDQSQ